MKVLMINSFHHPRGGDATYTRALTGLLEAAGHTVVPLAMRHPDNDPSPWETRFVSWVDPDRPRGAMALAGLGKRMVWSKESAAACRALIEDVQPDVAHLQHVHRHITPSVLDPLNAAGVPVVWTVHDHELVCPTGHLFTEGAPCERCRGGRYLEAIRHRCKHDALLPSIAVALEQAVHHRKRVWERVDRFLCPSRFLADTLIRFGVPPERVHHQPNFLRSDDHPPGDGPGEGWLYAGRLTVEKGIHTLVKAARKVPGATLTICGTGPLEHALKRATHDLPYVRWAGHLSPSALAAEIRRARVVVVPSLWYENFPYAVLEAQAAERAVVASRIGGIPEQVDDGVDGLLVPPGDADTLAARVNALLADSARCQALGRAARERIVATLTPEDHLQATLATYQAVTGG